MHSGNHNKDLPNNIKVKSSTSKWPHREPQRRLLNKIKVPVKSSTSHCPQSEHTAGLLTEPQDHKIRQLQGNYNEDPPNKKVPVKASTWYYCNWSTASKEAGSSIGLHCPSFLLSLHLLLLSSTSLFSPLSRVQTSSLPLLLSTTPTQH